MNVHTILAVDDQPEYLQSYAAYFFEEKVPHKVISALDGKMALELATIEKPDVIIMDWQMPVMDGLTAVKKLKNDAHLRDIPVIMATGIMMSSQDLKEAFEAGASDFIRKPIDKIELLARVHSHLSISKYIKQLKEHKNKIEQEREEHLSHVRETIAELCGKTIELIQYTNKEHENIAKELNNLRKNNQNEKIILEHISKTLSQICDACNKYSSVYNLHFQEDEYVKRLLKTHPNLLPNEIELCFFLKRNLSSKEIADISNRSVNTIKVARSKLRNKLNIETQNDIINYLVNI